MLMDDSFDELSDLFIPPIKDYNLPLQRKMPQILNLVDKLEKKNKDQEDKKRNEDSSRSNSIQGRKLSFCDPQITISQHTFDNRDNSQETFRDRIQRLSVAATYPMATNQPSQEYYISSIEALVGQPLTATNIRQVAQEQKLSHGDSVIGRRGNHNPRQSKEKTKKKLKKVPSLAQLNSNIRNQHGIRPQIQRPNSSVGRISVQKYSENLFRSPSKERKSLQHSLSTGHISAVNRKQIINKSNRNSHNPTGFQLTFNNKSPKVKENQIISEVNRESVAPPAMRKSQISTINEDRPQQQNTEKLQVLKVSRPKTAAVNENRIRRVDDKKQPQKSHSGSKNREPRSSSASPYRKQNEIRPPQSSTTKQRPRTSSGGKVTSPEPLKSHRVKSPISPGQQLGDRQSSVSIDRLVKESIKRQVQKQKEKLQQMKEDKENNNKKRKQMYIQNQIIRNRNSLKKDSPTRLSNMCAPLKSEERIISTSRAKSPRPPFTVLNNKNNDMPMLLRPSLDKPDIQKKPVYDLGLQIFAVKREMGYIGLESNRSQKPNIKKPRSASPIRSQKKHQKKQKLILQQQKQWVNKIKKERIQEIMVQQKVLNNLQQLNLVIDHKRGHIRGKQPIIVKKKRIINITTHNDRGTPDIIAKNGIHIHKSRELNQNRSYDGMKKKKVTMQQMLIGKLIKQVEIQRQQIENLKQNQQRIEGKISTKPDTQIQQALPDKEESIFDLPPSNDKIQIDDDMMIFCVLTTAATVIQKKFREYIQRKKRDLSLDSARFEDRFVPVVKQPTAVIPNQQEPVVLPKKVAKNTFSFGQDVKQKQQIETTSQQISFVIEETSPSNQSIPLNKEVPPPPPPPASNQSPRSQVDQVLKINEKFKFSLRNIAEKQKTVNVLEKMQQKKKSVQKSKIPIKIDEQRYFINDNSMVNDIKEEQSIELKPIELMSSKAIDINNSLENFVDDIATLENRDTLEEKLLVDAFKREDEFFLLQDQSSIKDINDSINHLDLKQDEDQQFILLPRLEDEELKEAYHSQKNNRKKTHDYMSVPETNKQILRMMFGDEKFLLDHDFASLPGSPHSHQLENPYFLATNTSVFDRNPFQEFTSNKLSDLMAGKNHREVLAMRDEALQFHEHIEKGFINRLEKREEASPSSIQRRKYELEKWVSSAVKEEHESQHPMNLFELQEERKEAAMIIERVNKKAKELKDKITKVAGQISVAIEEAKSSDVSDFINLQHSIEDILPSNSQSNIRRDQSADEAIELTFDDDLHNNRALVTLNLDIEEVKETPLDISVEEEEEEQVYNKQAEDLTESLFQEIILKEIANMQFQRMQQVIESVIIKEDIQLIPEIALEIERQIEIPPLKEQMIQIGIDTSEGAIEQYIEDIFEQIRPRKDQFLQAFITPIYKNPLDVLTHLQRPDYGNGASDENNAANLLDATSSLAYILNVQLYLTLEKAKENLIQETIEQIRRQHLLSSNNPLRLMDEELTDLMSEAQHIHNKVIFDCVNEGLNMVRPYGNQGEPMPWSKKPKRNLFYLFDTANDIDSVLHQAKNNVLSWAHTKVGALPFHSKNEEDPAFAQHRERCLAGLLAQELVRDEDKWLDYEMEEAQVKIDLSDIVLEHLVGETVDILAKLMGDRVI